MRKFLALLFLSSHLIAQPARIDYIHIPKCGGMTINLLLRQQLPEAKKYPYPDLHHVFEQNSIRIGQMSVSPALRASILKRFPMVAPKQNLVSIHAPYWFLKAKDPKFEDSFIFTSLREPIERVQSEYRFKRKFFNDISYDAIPTNSLCYYLCSDPSLEGEELVADCIRNLERLDHIIFLDDFDVGVSELFQKLGKRIEEVPVTNTTQYEPISDELRCDLIEKNRWDIELYRYAKEHFSRKTPKCL